MKAAKREKKFQHAKSAEKASNYLSGWMQNYEERLIKDFKTATADELLEIKGKFIVLADLKAKIANDIKTGAIVLKELEDEFNAEK